RELNQYGPDLASPWPYAYGESLGAPRYVHVPTPPQQRSAEWYLEAHLEHVARARAAKGADEVQAIDADLVGVDLTPAGAALPSLLDVDELVREPRKWIAKGSTVAYTTSFDAEERTFLLSADHVFIPKDRVRPYPRSTFEGVHLGGATKLP